MNRVLKRMDNIANVKMGKDTYGEMNKKTAGMSAYDKISYFSEVMSSPEFKAHTEELIKTAQEQKAKAEGKKGVEAENAEVKADKDTQVDNISVHNEGEINNNINTSDDNTQVKTVSNINENINKEDVINNGTLYNSQDNSIDTDSGISENSQVINDAADNVKTDNQANNTGINAEGKTNYSIINQESQNNAVGNENGIANGDGMGYKGEDGNILNTKNIPKLANATDFQNYVAEIAKRQDITKDEKVLHIQEAYKLTENKTDINCPIDTKYVNDISIDGDIYYNWPKFLGFIKKSITSITRENTLPKIWDRIGSLRGSNFTTLSADGQSYTSEQRSVPYIENESAKHNGTFKTEHYFDIIDAIRNGNLEAFNAIRNIQGKSKLDITDLIYYKGKYDKFLKKVKNEGIVIDATYGLQGYAAPWKLNGKVALKCGAPQFVTPFTGEILNDLGLLEIKK